MVPPAIMLLRDAAQNYSLLRREAFLQHVNPQLQRLMKDTDFKVA